MNNYTRTSHSGEITDLPFVKDINDDNRTFWSVTATGSYEEDYAIGELYARRALGYIKQSNATFLLGWAVKEMPEKFTGVESGFLNTIAKIAA